MNKHHLNWIEISRSSLENNLGQFRKLAGPDRLLLAMVKANAYGHGMLDVSAVALKSGADWLGVHTLGEAAELRAGGFDCPILIVGYVPLSELEEAVRMDLRLTVYNNETIDRLAELTSRIRIPARLHVKLETGTFRQGVPMPKAKAFLTGIREHPFLELEGLSSHFANIEDTTDHSYARYQLDNFFGMVSLLEAGGIKIPIKHFSCSAAAILFPETYFDMVRTGIGMYGLWPSKETYLSCLMANRNPVHLEPVLSWKARIAQLKEVPKGAMVGYGCTFKSGRTSRIAVIPVGYYDGYPRSLSNVSHVLIRGERAPLRGRVAMDFMVVDVTDISGLNIEDEVVLIGESGSDKITADQLASWDGTIHYEIVSRIHAAIPRILV